VAANFASKVGGMRFFVIAASLFTVAVLVVPHP
jgi:hypothetical protein